MANRDLFMGFVVGGLIGAAIGILFAPKSGRETREDIAETAQDLYEKTLDKYNQSLDKMSELTQRGKDLFTDKKDKLKKAVAAGVETYKEEKSASYKM